MTSLETKLRSDEHRITDLEKRQDDLDKLVSTVEALAVREKNVEEDVKEMKSDVKTLVNKPGKKWENMSEKIAFAIVSAIIGFVLAKLGF